MANTPPTGTVEISGNAREGFLIHPSSWSTLADADGLVGPFSYQWQSSTDGVVWTDIADADDFGFVPTDDQVGLILRVNVAYVDGGGTAETISSEWTDPVADSLFGSDSVDMLVGTAQGDTLDGLGGNDGLAGLGGDDLLDGGGGIDSAVYAMTRDNYDVTLMESNVVVHAGVGTEGTDTLRNVERARFSDMGVALDLKGNAGTTVRLIGAVFGPEQVHNRDYVGIGLTALDNGMTPIAVAQAALDARLGANASANDIVSVLYANLIGSEIPAADLAYWTGQLANGTYTPAWLALAAAESDYVAARIDLLGLEATGIEFTPYG